eukprot:6443707-Amphidinium_carterae.2
MPSTLERSSLSCWARYTSFTTIRYQRTLEAYFKGRKVTVNYNPMKLTACKGCLNRSTCA